MIDNYGRNIDYLRISITDKCNLRCRYCMPKNGVPYICHENILSFEEIKKIAKAFVEIGIEKIRITGGEPLVRKNAIDLFSNLSQIKPDIDLRLTTNGTLLKQNINSLKNSGVTTMNVSLDTLNRFKYSHITRGGNLSDTLSALDKALELGIKIKLNTVLIGGFNEDEIREFISLTKSKDIDVRFIELMAIGQASKWNKKRFISNKIVLNKMNNYTEDFSDPSSPAKYYKLENHLGKIGLISPISCKFCKNCNRVRLTSDGKLKLCLHTDDELDLKPYLNDHETLKKVLIEAIKQKPKEHNLETGSSIKKNMVAIGG